MREVLQPIQIGDSAAAMRKDTRHRKGSWTMNRKWMQLGFCMVALTLSAAAQTNVTNSNNGTSGTVPVYNGAASVINSPITVSGSNVGIGTTSPYGKLDVTSDATYDLPQMVIKGLTNINRQLFLGYDTSNNFGFIQPIEQDIAYRNLILNPHGGYVGIGTTAPLASLHVVGIAANSYNLMGWEQATPVATGTSYFAHRFTSYGGAIGWGGEVAGFLKQGVGGGLTFSTVNNTAPVEAMRIDYNGNVGIGTTSPGAKLEVDGSVKLTSGSGASITFADGSTQSTAWTGTVCGGDYAESVDVTGNRKKYEPGDILVIDSDHPGRFLKSAEPYSTSVTGIYSTKPGTVGRRQSGPKSPDEVPMAMIGIVPTKVSAENGPIHPGDLLVTSSTIGYAMKGTDRGRMLGAVIGKALGRIDSGKGVIEVVVTLQ